MTDMPPAATPTTRRAPLEILSERFETFAIAFAQILLIFVIGLILLELAWLLVQHRPRPNLETWIGGRPPANESGGLWRCALDSAGPRAPSTLRSYFTEHKVRLELILVAATIAVGRHVILIDLETTGGCGFIGVSALVLALTTGCFLTKRSFHRNG